jgi:hypothetical protein
MFLYQDKDASEYFKNCYSSKSCLFFYNTIYCLVMSNFAIFTEKSSQTYLRPMLPPGSKTGSLFIPMEQCALKIVNNGLNTNIYSFLETSGGQSFNLYLNVVLFRRHDIEHNDT